MNPSSRALVTHLLCSSQYRLLRMQEEWMKKWGLSTEWQYYPEHILSQQSLLYVKREACITLYPHHKSIVLLQNNSLSKAVYILFFSCILLLYFQVCIYYSETLSFSYIKQCYILISFLADKIESNPCTENNTMLVCSSNHFANTTHWHSEHTKLSPDQWPLA